MAARLASLFAAVLMAALPGCAAQEPIAMKISSPAFANDSSIPSLYTCDGEDYVPPLEFKDVPLGTVGLALVVDDPDAPAGTWDHWLVWDIPSGTPGIGEASLPPGTVGRNGWGKAAWGGPCPPRGEHRYFFRLYALDTRLDLPQASSRAALERAMKGHVLAEATLMGRYERKRR